MIERNVFTTALSLLIVIAAMQASTAAQPSPPPQVCVNNQCVNSLAAAATAGTTGKKIKWNPGHYMASNKVLYGGTVSDVQPEMDDLNNQDAMLGYRVFMTWSAIEDATAGSYDFTLLDAISNRLKTAYNKPKRLVLVVLPGSFGGGGVPRYITSSSVYGPSPNSGSYGWWGPGNGAAGGIVAAVWRPAVMARFTALISALGAHFDKDPYFEGIMIQEDSWMLSAAVTSPSDYNDDDFVTQLKSLLTTATTTAFPTTNVIMQNSWLKSSTVTQQFEQWMVQHRVAPSSADTLGRTAFDMGFGTAELGLAWGLKAYFGLTQTGSSYSGPDYRGITHAMLDVEADDLAGYYYDSWGGSPDGFSPLDIINAANTSYKASHLFWTHLQGTEETGHTVGRGIPTRARWPQLAATCAANPLTNVSYPSSYP